MTKAEELISKHLDRLNANNIIGKDGNIYKGFLNAINEALTITVVTSTLPNIDSTEFRDWLKSELFVVAGLLCVDDTNCDYITRGNTYKLIEEGEILYTILDNDGDEIKYYKNKFTKIYK